MNTETKAVRDEACDIALASQVADQCRVVAHLATALARVHSDYAKLAVAPAFQDILGQVGERSAALMEQLGEALNEMDASSPEDQWTAPIFERAQRLYPLASAGEAGRDPSGPGHSRAEPSGLGPGGECPSRGPTITVAQIAEMDRLSYQASPGIWSVWPERIRSREDAIRELVEQVEKTEPLGGHLFLLNADGKCPATAGCGPLSEANAEFIAALVNGYRSGHLRPAPCDRSPKGRGEDSARESAVPEGQALNSPTAPQGADLAGLSAAATQGVWQQSKIYLQEINVERPDGREVLVLTAVTGDGDASADRAFACALVNAYRSGALVPADSAPPAGADRDRIRIDYTNYRGERSIRTISAWGVEWGSTEFHPEPQWLVTGYDHDKHACRVYALRDIHAWNGVPTENPAALAHPGSVASTSGERDHETAASCDVLAERRRQIEAEGYTTAHDDEHDKGEIARAAACYARIASDWDNYAFPEGCPADWPWSPVYWKWTDPRRDLVKAGALILAEIERLDRAVPPPASQNEGERP